MRFYENLNETKGLGDLLEEVQARYSEFTDGQVGADKPWLTVKTSGPDARLDNRFGLCPEIRRYVLYYVNELITAFRTADLWRDQGSDWPRARLNPDISMAIASQTNAVELFMYGVLTNEDGTHYGPGYFALNSLHNTALLPAVTAEDIEVTSLVPSGRKGPNADRIFKLLWMLRNTLDYSKNPTIGWLVPTRKFTPELAATYLAQITGAGNVQSIVNGHDGTLAGQAMSAVVNAMIPPGTIRTQYNRPTTWERQQAGGPGISFETNDRAQAAQLRSWAQHTAQYRAKWLDGTTWQDMFDAEYGSGLDDVEDILNPDRLLERLRTQQTIAAKNILNQSL